MKNIAIIVGSKSDLKQGFLGLEFLKGSSDVSVQIYIRSQHRHTLLLQKLLWELSKWADVAIIGAGWANHLTACSDAFLRREIKTTKMPVIGVAFKDEKNEKHTKAAILSMTEVPGTQTIYQDADGIFVGEHGFYRACKLAVLGNLPEMKIPEPVDIWDPTLDEAISFAIEK